MGNFSWTEDSLRWMQDAAAYGDYYERLAGWIKAYLPASARVLEAGCGTGALSRALAPWVASVTALDVSALALEGLLSDRPANVHPVVADAFAYKPKLPFDALLLCYFARPSEFLRLSPLCRGTAILICDAGRSPAYEAALTAQGIPFDRSLFSLRLDQPLRSYEDAGAYATHYGRTDAAVRQDDPVFPYLYEITRNMALLCYPCGGQ